MAKVRERNNKGPKRISDLPWCLATAAGVKFRWNFWENKRHAADGGAEAKRFAGGHRSRGVHWRSPGALPAREGFHADPRGRQEAAAGLVSADSGGRIAVPGCEPGGKLPTGLRGGHRSVQPRRRHGG